MNGLILLDKPEGITSFTAVAIMKRVYGTKRVGHTGTLDPLATGVLPILIGRATRLSNFILEGEKRYTAGIRLGIKTDTLDITGEILEQKEFSVTEDELRNVINSFLGKSFQVPPMYSAIKIGGKKLYELAREGQTVERKPREIEIKEINLLDFDGENFSVDVLCSKGTYIRSLADDIGKRLGCGAVMTSLRRTATVGFSIEECATLEEIKEHPGKYIVSAENALPDFSSVYVTEKQGGRFCSGGELSLDRLVLSENHTEYIKVFSKNEFLGLGFVDKERASLKIECIIKE